MTEALLEASGLVVAPGRDPLDLSIGRGECLALTGPEGGRIGTMMRVLAGLEPPVSGTIRLLGRTPDAWPWQTLRRQAGFASPMAPLLSVVDGLRNVMLPALYHQLAPEETVLMRARELIGETGFDGDPERLPAYMHELQRRFLAIARALILSPSLLFVDAPIRGLGTAAAERMRDYLLGPVRQRVPALILCADDMLLAHRADRVVFVGETQQHTFHDWPALLASNDPEIQHYLALGRRVHEVFERHE